MSVVLPQPEGPRKTISSPFSMSMDTSSMTAIGRARASAWHVLVTRSMRMKGVMAPASSQIREVAPVRPADSLVGEQADDADSDDAGEDLGCLVVAACRHDHETDAGVGGDDLGDDDVGPAPTQG